MQAAQSAGSNAGLGDAAGAIVAGIANDDANEGAAAGVNTWSQTGARSAATSCGKRSDYFASHSRTALALQKVLKRLPRSRKLRGQVLPRQSTGA